MSNLLIHAGMPKTASTTIQTALASPAWRTVLHDAGLCPLSGLPNCGKHVHALLGQPTWRPANERVALVSEFERALDEAVFGGQRVLISAEAIFDIARNLHALATLHEFLGRFFGDFAVVLYVREPMSYLSSRVQQALKAGYSLETSLRNLESKCDMLASLRNLEATFGKESVRVRSFDRQLLDGGNVLRDFAVHLLGLPQERLPDELLAINSQNFALTREVLDAVLDLYRVRGIDARTRTPDFGLLLGSVRWVGTPFSLAGLPAPIFADIAEMADRSRAALWEYFGFDPFPSHSAEAEHPTPHPEAKRQAALATNLALLDQLIAHASAALERPAPGPPGASGLPEEPHNLLSQRLGLLYDLHAARMVQTRRRKTLEAAK